MSAVFSFRLPNRAALNIHPPLEKGSLASITLANYISESFCIGGRITVFDPNFVATQNRENNWALPNKVFDKNDIKGLGARMRFAPKTASNTAPIPVEMAVQVFPRKTGKYKMKPASIFCPTLQLLSSFSKKMPREFKTPAIAEVAVPIFASESRTWDKTITAPEINLARVWHIGESQGYGDEELFAKLSTPTWHLTLDAVRKLRTRNGFNSSAKHLLRNAPDDDVPKAFTTRINEIFEATGQSTVNDHHLHRLLGSLFCWGFDLALMIT